MKYKTIKLLLLLINYLLYKYSLLHDNNVFNVFSVFSVLDFNFLN
jgi:hypothetical protein